MASNYFGFSDESYIEKIKRFLSIEKIVAQIKNLEENYPSALNLVCVDWQSKLKDSEQFKLWQAGFKCQERKSTKEFKVYTIPKKNQFTIITVADISFYRKNKYERDS